MDLIKNYEQALQAIYDHVGFTEDWVVCPISDNTQYFWALDGDEVKYASSIQESENEEGECYLGSIYRQRFYEKHVYEGKDFTMVFLDAHTDGMKYFALFDNAKKHEYER